MQTLTNILSSLLVQLVRCSRKVSHEIQDKFEEWRQRADLPDDNEYVRMINSQAMEFLRIYLVVDGLDQCCSDTSTNTLYEFLNICGKLPRKFHSLFTTRTGLHSQVLRPDCEVEIKAHRDDISAYLKSFINNRQVMQSIVDEGHRHNHSFYEYIVNSVVGRSDGL